MNLGVPEQTVYYGDVMRIAEEYKKGEGYDLEFKLVPNEERIKYLKTVVSFANGNGGKT